MIGYDRVAVGERVRRLRLQKGWSRNRLAEALDISERHCSSVELGETGISISLLLRLSRVLGTSTDELLFAHGSLLRDKPYHKMIASLQQCPPKQLEYLEQIVRDYVLSFE